MTMKLSRRIKKDVVITSVDNVNFSDNYDVIVAGLGTAGAIAAIAAARYGLKVLGIDRLNCMGGMMTAGAVTGYYFGSKGGLYEEIDKKISQYVGNVYTGGSGTDSRKYVLEQEAVRYGVKLSYETTITGVFLEGKTVKGIQCVNNEGMKTVGCKVLIDCTGDAEICAMMGCAAYQGRDLDGKTQPFTSVKVSIIGNKISKTNFDSGWVDQTDGWDLTNAIITAHACHVKDKYDSSERLLYLAPLIGIREGRLIKGKEMVRLDEFFQGKITKEPLFYAHADIDKHGWDHAFESETLQDWFVASNLGAVNVSFPIPLGSLIPEGYEGVLVAGRCISVDHDVSTSVRMNRDMQKSGEAAAAAAWLSIKKNLPLKDLPYEDLLSLLKETGCYDEKNDLGYQQTYRIDGKLVSEKIEWLQDSNLIKQGLSSEKPGIAIWSAKRLGESIKEKLIEWINEAQQNTDKSERTEALKKHSAIALALIGGKEALPILRSMIKERDSFILKDCRKNNQMRGFIAIYLAGKLRDTEIIDELIDIICNPKEFEKPLYQDKNLSTIRYAVEGYNDIYFQFFSHSVMALTKIGDKYEEYREKISKALKEAIKDDQYITRMINNKPEIYEYCMVANISNVVHKKLEEWSK